MSEQDPNIGKPLFAANLKDRNALLHQICTDLGLEAEKAMGSLKYKGEINGRFITFTAAVRTRSQYVTPDIRYRKYTGWLITLTATTPVKTYLLFNSNQTKQQGLVRFIQKRQGNQQVQDLGRFYDDFVVWAREPEWARRFLGETAVSSALQSLYTDNRTDGNSTKNVLNFAPGSCSLTISQPPNMVAKEDIDHWLTQLTQLVETAESYPPLHEAKLHWIGQQFEAGRGFFVVLAFMVGAPLLIFICCVFPIMLAAILSAR